MILFQRGNKFCYNRLASLFSHKLLAMVGYLLTYVRSHFKTDPRVPLSKQNQTYVRCRSTTVVHVPDSHDKDKVNHKGRVRLM